ncbi:MAG TPA: hypothetical protein VF267_14575 [Gammaproteobacteria bacterium]
MVLSRLFLLAACLLPFTAHAGRAGSAITAVEARNVVSDLRFEDGTLAERRFRRAGIEYLEGIAKHVYLGFGFGYTESEGREAARPFETIAGNYGSLVLLFDASLADNASLRGRIEYLLQRDRHDASGDVEFETRALIARAELGALFRFRQLELSLGASIRDLDYRDTQRESASEIVRHAKGVDATGAFAALGWRNGNDGGIALRYDTGGETGWVLRFERKF